MVGTLFLTFAVMARAVFGENDDDDEDNGVWTWSNMVIIMYLVLLIVTFIVVIGVIPAKTKRTYYILMFIFGLYMVFNTVMLALFLLFEGFDTAILLTLTVGTVFMFAMVIICH